MEAAIDLLIIYDVFWEEQGIYDKEINRVWLKQGGTDVDRRHA